MCLRQCTFPFFSLFVFPHRLQATFSTPFVAALPAAFLAAVESTDIATDIATEQSTDIAAEPTAITATVSSADLPAIQPPLASADSWPKQVCAVGPSFAMYRLT